MKIVFNNLRNTYYQSFGTKQRHFSPKIGCDSFSVLDKYNEHYKHTYVKDIIPDLKEFIKRQGTIKEGDIKGIAGHGGLTIVFDLGDSEVLKCSLENPLEYRRHYPEFDIPFLSPVIKSNNTYIVKQPKAETNNITIDDCKDVIRRILNAGLELSNDMSVYKTCQIGKYNGKNYLLDTRCAVPRPNAFSRFVYNFCKRHRRVIIVRSMSTEALREYHKEMMMLVEKEGPQALHVNEAPRKNLSLGQGLLKIWNLMKENMKYRKFPL